MSQGCAQLFLQRPERYALALSRVQVGNVTRTEAEDSPEDTLVLGPCLMTLPA